MNPIQLRKGDEVIDLNEHPSLLALMHAQQRGVESSIEEIEDISNEIDELREREQMLGDLGQSVKGIRMMIGRRNRQIRLIRERLLAYKANYIEVPDPDGRILSIEDTITHEGDWIWGDQLPNDTPIDALRALKHAKDKGIFQEFRIMLPERRRRRDPMIYGIAGDACFYVASWR